MSERSDANDEIQTISVKLQAITTAESNLNSIEMTKLPKADNSLPSRSHDTNKDSFPESKPITRNLPSINMLEKIIIALDVSREQEYTPYKMAGTGIKYTPLTMIKRVVEIFLMIKTSMPVKHQFALIVLDCRRAQWVCNFTETPADIVHHLQRIDERLHSDEYFDLGQLFNLISPHDHLPLVNSGRNSSNFVTRLILIYTRSFCAPKFQTGRSHFDSLVSNPYFFVDVLYVHEPSSPSNNCKDIFDELATLDTTSFSYILEIGRNATKLHSEMAKLAAHPLQRPLQNNMEYALPPLVM